MTQLRKRMIEDMQLRRFSVNTQESYVRAVFGLARYYRKSPDQINGNQLKNYVLFLTNDETLNGVLSIPSQLACVSYTQKPRAARIWHCQSHHAKHRNACRRFLAKVNCFYSLPE